METVLRTTPQTGGISFCAYRFCQTAAGEDDTSPCSRAISLHGTIQPARQITFCAYRFDSALRQIVI